MAARRKDTGRPRSPVWTVMKRIRFSGTESIASYATGAPGSPRRARLPRRGSPVAVRAVRGAAPTAGEAGAVP
ncbi:hypothetical protein ACFCXH_25780 [Streptomyces nojiriensis]|uniref:hypothetical protein n=1 Tax=Streptomyces nojiriensis TaxID=66374 RepID=UPI0035D6D7E8